MLVPLDPLADAAVILGLCTVGLTQLRSGLMLYGIQACLLGVLAIWTGGEHGEPALVIAGAATLVLKGIVVPLYLATVARRIGCRRDESLAVAPPLLMLLTLTALSGLTLRPPFEAEFAATGVPALALLMIGMILMVTRRLAVGQILGFLTLENGIFLYAISQPHSMPVIVEVGALLDLLVATMLAGVLVFHINDRFDHIDVTELKKLRG